MKKLQNFNPIKPLDIMRYYVTYFDIEKAILENIDSDDETFRINSINRYLNHTRIARNFISKSGPKLLKTTKSYANSKKLNINELSDIFHSQNLLSGDNKNAIVASSKLLWLFNKEVIIMDNINMKSLGAKDYESYVHEWQKLFKLKEQEIIDVINRTFKDLESIVHEKWFRMRVFDQYLLTQ